MYMQGPWKAKEKMAEADLEEAKEKMVDIEEEGKGSFEGWQRWKAHGELLPLLLLLFCARWWF